MKERLISISNDQSSIKAHQAGVSSKLDTVMSDIQSLRQSLADKDAEIVELRSSIESHLAERVKLEKRLLDLEVKDRQLNLIVHGLPKEKLGQSLTENIETLFKEKLEIEKDIALKKVYRIKSVSPITVRNNKQAGVSPVLISCANNLDLKMLLGNVGKLKGSGMRICTDLPPSLNALRNELLAKARDLKAQQISKFT